MANEASKGGSDQRGKSAEKKTKSADQSSADDADVSSKPPSRIHIFPSKTSLGDSSKSGGEPLRCSSFRTNRPIDSPHGVGQAAILVGVRPATIGLKGELIRLGHQIRKRKRALYEAAMKAEDLEATIQGLRRTWERISKKRK